MDLILRGANLADGRRGMDIGIADGRIVAVQPQLAAAARDEIDVAGRLVSSPFVDCHFHMDATMSVGLPRLNRSGTLLEGIALWGELKPLLTQEAIFERAMHYCDWAIARGLLAIRSHVDVCDPRLLAVDALLEVKRRVKPYIDLQLVAFPQDGYYRFPGAVQLLEQALDRGVDVVGGIPHFERTRADGDLSVRALLEIAANRGLRVDLHCDETDDPTSRHVEVLAAETIRLGLQGRVTGSHLTSMHGMDNYYVSKLIDLMAEAELTVVSNPLISITMQGRHDAFPKRRGMARVEDLMKRGVNCAFGQDCCMDPWYALGSADMLEVAHMGLHVAQLTSLDGMAECFACVTERAAGVFGLEGYGVAPGCNADLVVLQAGDPVEAMQFRAPRLLVIRRGRVIAETAPADPRLHVPGRPSQVRFERPGHGRG